MRAPQPPTRSLARGLSFAVFVAATAIALLVSPAAAAPEFGFLQFKVEHNLETPACLATGTCQLGFEEFENPASWLAEIRAASDLAVFHWDRAVPWLVFDPEPPAAVDRVAYYDARLDAPTLARIDAFAAHFAAMEKGYLAVSILGGERDRLAPLHVGQGDERIFPTRCPDFSPGTQVTIDPGTGPQSFDLARSYRNFVLYLARKLEPDYLALMVEVNLIEGPCPTRADGLYALYRAIHDQVQAELGTGPLLFATLSLPPLLAYERQTCYPSSGFAPCAGPPATPAPPLSAEACYPTDRSVVDALSLGGRLDLLALSFYPDGLEMRSVPNESPQTRAYLVPSWNAGGQCLAALPFSVPIDPLAAIDRLGWNGPIAIAETSARSCPTPLYVDLPMAGGTTPMILEAPGSPASQAAWVSQTYQTAVARDYVFYVHSFLRDYPPIGPWIAEQGIIAPQIQALLNTWPCSGLQDPSGAWKPEMLAIGLPEPGSAVILGAGCGWLLGLCWVRDRWGARNRSFSPVGNRR